jgi:hypothetical protein
MATISAEGFRGFPVKKTPFLRIRSAFGFFHGWHETKKAAKRNIKDV